MQPEVLAGEEINTFRSSESGNLQLSPILSTNCEFTTHLIVQSEIAFGLELHTHTDITIPHRGQRVHFHSPSWSLLLSLEN